MEDVKADPEVSSNGNGQDETQVLAQAQLVITLLADGRVGFSGPIENKVLCYGLLQMGLEMVSKHEAQEQPRIVRPMMTIPGRRNHRH